MNSVILASASPRRLELLTLAGYDCTVVKPCVDENIPYDSPEDYVQKLSRIKAEAIACKNEGVVIAADTVVTVDGRILGKPKDAQDAKNMLMSLSDREHSVFTGFTVRCGDKSITQVSETRVVMRSITDGEIDAYVRSGDPLDKAGAYGIQCAAGMFVSEIKGDYYTVVGLPICPISVILREHFGIEPKL